MKNGYLALPKSGHGPGIMILHAWWGLNPFLKDFCERLAMEGFVVFAPDLYQGKVATTIEEARLLRSKLKQQKAHLDLLSNDRTDAFDPASAQLAWQRTVAFLKLHLAESYPAKEK